MRKEFGYTIVQGMDFRSCKQLLVYASREGLFLNPTVKSNIFVAVWTGVHDVLARGQAQGQQTASTRGYTSQNEAKDAKICAGS